MPPPAVPALLGADPVGLRRMKRTATGVLVSVTGVFLLSFALPDSAATGFLRSAAEAGMIGGLADWFAVTALFRHPLGLRIPHTALVPRQKDALATRLGEFVTGNFLTADAVADQLAEARLVRRAAQRLSEPTNTALVAAELAIAIGALLDALDEVAVTDTLLELARRDLARRSYAPVLGQLLARAVEGEGQRPLVDIAVSRVRDHLVEHREVLRPQVRRYLERQGVLVWLVTTDKRVDMLLTVAVEVLEDMERDPAHPVRRWLDDLLAAFVDDLRYDPATAARVDAQLAALLEDPYLQAALHAALSDGLHSVRASLEERDGGLQQRLAGLVARAATYVLADDSLEHRLEARLQAAVRYVVSSYGDTVVSIIQRTVAGWEARDAAARIEASVGRDLQFIRINGTVVGALAGVVIHAVALALA